MSSIAAIKGCTWMRIAQCRHDWRKQSETYVQQWFDSGYE